MIEKVISLDLELSCYEQIDLLSNRISRIKELLRGEKQMR